MHELSTFNNAQRAWYPVTRLDQLKATFLLKFSYRQEIKSYYFNSSYDRADRPIVSVVF